MARVCVPRRSALLVAAGLACSSQAAAQYAAVGSVPGSFIPGIDQPGNRRPITSGTVDDGAAAITIPAAYGNAILAAGAAYATTNGRLIGVSDPAYLNTDLSAAGALPGYYPMWDDLGLWPGPGGVPQTVGVGDEGIYTADTGGVFVVQWNGRPLNEGTSGVPAPQNRFKVQLQLRASGPAAAQFLYQGLGTVSGQSATVGVVQTSPAAAYSQFSFDQAGAIGNSTVVSVVPVPTGACCVPGDLSCVVTDSGNCGSRGGTFNGGAGACAQANCPTPGACCLQNGSCSPSTAAACAGQNGVYRGDSTPCSGANCNQIPSGACCAPAGTCSLKTVFACRASAGLYRGDNSSCGAGVCPRAYVYTGGAQPIPDGMGGSVCGAALHAEVTVPDTFTVGAADASVFVSAQWQGDIQLALVHVNTGTTAWLVRRPGVTESSPYGFGNWYYGDLTNNLPFRATDAGAFVYNSPPNGPLGSGSDYVNGLWKPQTPLAIFSGENAAGTWRLVAQDCANQFPAALDGFILNLTPGAAPACYANCDGSTGQPFLNVQDFSCFLQKFAAGAAYANCDASTTAPTLNVQDFSCFLNKFASGCSAP